MNVRKISCRMGSRRLLAVATAVGLTCGMGSRALADDRADDARSTRPDTVQKADSEEAGAGLGVTYISSPRGVMVADVKVDGPADKAGIKKGDRIISIAGERVDTAQEAVTKTGKLTTDAQVLVEISRGREQLEVAVVVGESRDAVRLRDDEKPEGTEEDDPKPARANSPVEKEVNLGWELATVKEGVRVERLEAGGPAAKGHLEEGDIIKNVGGENVLTPQAVYRVLNQMDAESQVEVTVEREGEEIAYLVTLPKDHKRDLTQGQNSDSQTQNSQRSSQTTRARVDLDEENLDERRLLMEIVRELRYQRGLLEALASQQQGRRPATAVPFDPDGVNPQPNPNPNPDPGPNPDPVPDPLPQEAPEVDRTNVPGGSTEFPEARPRR
ncbi:MAG: PDZ domain-containing protein [Planctomycetota bacterium]|nr:MAG: PDZ domain-containing protein [Planctomycetota bacterium]